MDYQLKGGPVFPESPSVGISLIGTGIPQAIVTTGGESIDRVDVYYALGDKPPPNRFWRVVPAKKDDTKWQAELPVADAWSPMFAFANVQYASGVCLTTNLERRVPGMLGKARATLHTGDAIAPRAIAESWFYARSYTDPVIEQTFVRVEDTADRAAVVSMNPEVFRELVTVDLSSHVLGDAQFAGVDGMALAFDCAGDFGAEGLRVSVVQNDWTPLVQTYMTTLSADELTPGWRTIVLPLGRFKIKDTEVTPAHWTDLDKMNLQGTTPASDPFRIANLRWVSGPAKK
jgi:hypothetical protein